MRTEKEEEEEEEEDEKKREKAKDDEYRLIYHQTYKGACFTFRTRMGEEPLQPWSDKVRETVDRLLALFCSDPFAQGLTALDDKLTPGGREAFGADRKGDEEEEASPFPKPTGDVGKEEEEEVKTPSWRKVRKEKDKTTTVKVMDVT
ncbi:hypothetical protein H2203_006712 [Taxawa tesnikishii (nom. ined.)]|nr:hypothetical protein H2203_006712 [Dothideales sp. JES 119]